MTSLQSTRLAIGLNGNTQILATRLLSLASLVSLGHAGQSLASSRIQGSDMPYQTRGMLCLVSSVRITHYMVIELSCSKETGWSFHQLKHLFENFAHLRELISKPIWVQKQKIMNPKDGSCKLFGIPLIGNHVTLEPTMSYRTMANERAGHLHLVSNAFDSDEKSELLRVLINR